MGDITWTNERRKLSDLIPWPRNPRQIKGANAVLLNESLDDFGLVETIAIGPGNEVYNGHQRLNVWAAEHGPDFVVDVRVSSRELEEKERERLVVLLHKGAAGEWDFDTLANEFDLDELLEWGFTPFELGMDAEDVDYDELWQGMPEFEHDDKTSEYSVKVHFACKEDLEAFAELVEQPVSEKAKSIWYPAATIEPEFDRRYVGQS